MRTWHTRRRSRSWTSPCPRRRSSWEASPRPPRGWTIAISGHFGYFGANQVSGYTPALHVLDLSTPTSPALVGELPTAGSFAQSVAFAEGYVYVAALESGLLVAPEHCNAPVPIHDEASPAPQVIPAGTWLGASHPNPFALATSIPIRLERAADVRVVVYDVAGRPVRTLADGALAAGTHRIGWDGRTAGGLNVAPGAYYVEMVTRREVMTRAVVRVP